MPRSHIRITGREEIADYRVFRVDRLTLQIDEIEESAEGSGMRSRARDAFVFRTRDWCNVVALTESDEIVFVRQFRYGTDSDTLELPGGVVDDGESPEHAAMRELREETGYEAGSPVPLVSVAANPALQNTQVHTFLVRGAVPSAGGSHFDEDESCEVVLVPRRELARRLDADEMVHSLCRLPLEVFLRRGL